MSTETYMCPINPIFSLWCPIFFGLCPIKICQCSGMTVWVKSSQIESVRRWMYDAMVAATIAATVASISCNDHVYHRDTVSSIRAATVQIWANKKLTVVELMQPNLAAVAATVAATIAPCIHSLCFGGTALYTQISHTNRKDEVKDEEFQLLAAVMMLLSLVSVTTTRQ